MPLTAEYQNALYRTAKAAGWGHGKIAPRNLLTVGNPKTAKGEAAGWYTAVLHLAPYTVAGGGNVCPFATPGCAAACLNTAGRGGIFKAGETTNAIQDARIRRTRFYQTDRAAFVAVLMDAIKRHVRHARKLRLRPAVRLNGTSDIIWERVAPEIFAAFPRVRFYDYTKIAARFAPTWKLPANYSLTFSRAETAASDLAARAVLANGGNVAAVFSTRKGRELPAAWAGFRVIDGDAHDLRFLDARGTVAGLRAKGRGRRDTSGFVITAAA